MPKDKSDRNCPQYHHNEQGTGILIKYIIWKHFEPSFSILKNKIRVQTESRPLVTLLELLEKE